MKKQTLYSGRLIAAVFILCLALGPAATQAQVSASPRTGSDLTVLYVKPGIGAGASCTSWEQACNLPTALQNAPSFSMIWVAAGVHYPNDNNPADLTRTQTFNLKSHVYIYGGFSGTETDTGQRDRLRNLTILSGDLNRNGVIDEDAYHVVTSSGVNDYSILDGFTITMGRASLNGDLWHDTGGGILNKAGSSLTYANLVIVRNRAYGGGGMYNNNSSPRLVNVTFSENYAVLYGGGVYNFENSSPRLTNVIFYKNTSDDKGGGMLNTVGSSPTLVNVTWNSNTAISGGGLYNANTGGATVSNSILWGNVPNQIVHEGGSLAVTYSDIQGGYSGEGNISSDPLFIDIASGNLRLRPGSAAIEAGNNEEPSLAGATYDRDGSSRFVDYDGDGGAVIDMGAYEAQLPADILYVDSTAAGPVYTGLTWEQAFRDLQSALAVATDGTEVWVASGIYRPGGIGDQLASFRIESQVAVYGGFPGGGGAWEERDWTAYPAILSGDLDHNDVTVGGVVTSTSQIVGANAYHVVVTAGITSTQTLDGFTITAGDARGGDFPHNSGGGTYNFSGSPSFAHVTFSGNRAKDFGGGMLIVSARGTLTDVTFSGNTSDMGGGISVKDSELLIHNTLFSGNTALMGGGLYSFDSAVILENVTFSDNKAATEGGGMRTRSGNASLANVTFSGNTAAYGGGLQIYTRDYDNTTVLTNCILWGNTPDQVDITFPGDAGKVEISYSAMLGGCPNGALCGVDVVDADPLLGPLADNGGPTLTLALRDASPAIDAGSPVSCPTTDQRGFPRPVDGNFDGVARCDMGAYEFEVKQVFLPLVRR